MILRVTWVEHIHAFDVDYLTRKQSDACRRLGLLELTHLKLELAHLKVGHT